MLVLQLNVTLLNTISGSDLEDRQYEVNIIGISMSISSWDEIEALINVPSFGGSQLKTMSENPALEWNLGNGRFNNSENISLCPIIEK